MRIDRTDISTDVTLTIFRIVNFLPGYVFNLLKSLLGCHIQSFLGAGINVSSIQLQDMPDMQENVRQSSLQLAFLQPRCLKKN